MRRNYIADARRQRSYFMKIGLIIALGASILAFRWKVYPKSSEYLVLLEEPESIVEIIPRTKHQVKRVPPPVLPKLTDDILPTALEVEFTDEFLTKDVEQATADMLIEDEDFSPSIDYGNPNKEKPLLPIPEEKEEEPEIFRIVEEMPVFGDCTELEKKEKRRKCSDLAIFQYLSSAIQYPALARDNGIQGTVVIQFIIEPTGEVSSTKIVRDIGGRCGQEALRVVTEMPNWKPGIQRGRNVKVQMNLPVKFKLH